eukprot:14903529-Alexandrium_andersonii.AAC.1
MRTTHSCAASTTWMEIYQGQCDQSAPPILARETLLTQLRKATGMVGVIDYYDRLPPVIRRRRMSGSLPPSAAVLTA